MTPQYQRAHLTSKILVSQHHSPLKGNRAPWRTGCFKDGAGQVQDKHKTSWDAQNKKAPQNMRRNYLKDTGVNLKDLPMVKSERIWARKLMMTVMVYNQQNKANTHKSTRMLVSKWINKQRREAVPYSRMPICKCIWNGGKRKLPLGERHSKDCHRRELPRDLNMWWEADLHNLKALPDKMFIYYNGKTGTF